MEVMLVAVCSPRRSIQFRQSTSTPLSRVPLRTVTSVPRWLIVLEGKGSLAIKSRVASIEGSCFLVLVVCLVALESNRKIVVYGMESYRPTEVQALSNAVHTLS